MGGRGSVWCEMRGEGKYLSWTLGIIVHNGSNIPSALLCLVCNRKGGRVVCALLGWVGLKRGGGMEASVASSVVDEGKHLREVT